LFFENSFSGMLEETASLNRYGYAHGNPNKFRDPSGNYVESAWDIFSLGVGLVSFAYNIKEGQYGAAALDAVGIVADTVALAVPLLPGGAGAAIKASRAVQATVKGLQTVDRAANAGMAVANAYVEYTQGNYGWAALNAGFAVLGAKGAYESATGVRAAWKATTAVPDPLKTVQRQGDQIAEVIGEGNDEVADLVKPMNGGLKGQLPRKPILDDPLIDNNTLTRIIDGDLDALKFAERQRGKLSVTDRIKNEALAKHSLSVVDKALEDFEISMLPHASDLEVLAFMKQMKITSQKRFVDASLVLDAQLNKVGLVTGDHGVFSLAIRSGLKDVRYRVFEGTEKEIINGYERARRISQQNTPTISPHFYTGSREGR
jgi:Novel toxin 10